MAFEMFSHDRMLVMPTPLRERAGVRAVFA